MKKNIVIFWFRRDLRLDDNHGFFKALSSENKVLPIFIFDPEILDKLPQDDARVNFIYNQLEQLNIGLENHGCIQTYHGQPKEIFDKITVQYNVKAVYANHDYEPYAIKRDDSIAKFLGSKNIEFLTFKDQVIFERNNVVKEDGTPYKVYTPFSKKWLTLFRIEHCNAFPSEQLLENLYHDENKQWVSLEQLGFKESAISLPAVNISKALLDTYEANRNTPSIDGTSKLGPHLRFGTVSVRQMVKKAYDCTNHTFLKELIWREFFMQILWHFPHTVTQSFKPQYDNIKWRNNKAEFEAWCQGKTGYPLVDAGMRELNTTGFMHNRVRMLVGSFLCKHLLIDWRWGEAYFAKKLLDFELSSNIGNWQWVAGSGVDAAPYFRIFNPTTQIEKFDKKHHYIKQWVPEYQEFTYPRPIVDHKIARERCLETYKSALNV